MIGAILCFGVAASLSSCSFDALTTAPTEEVILADRLVVVPPEAVLTVGSTIRLFANPETLDGAGVPGYEITWESSDDTIATVSGDGLVTALSLGTATITATAERDPARPKGKAGAPGQLKKTARIIVDSAQVASVEVSPASASIDVGGSVQLATVVRDADGNVLGGRQVSWSSSNRAVAPVNSSGLVIGSSEGTAIIAATCEGQSGGAGIVVASSAPAVSYLDVTPDSASVQVGGTVRFTAVPYDASGNPLSNRTVTWASSDPQVATVDGSGLVSAAATGAALISAISEGKADTASVTVSSAPLTRIEVLPAAVTVAPGGLASFRAIGIDANGDTVAVSVAWSTNGGTIDQRGNWQAPSTEGSYQVTATTGQFSDTATGTVRQQANNEPPGFSPFLENDFTTQPTWPGGFDGLMGYWWAYGQGNITLVSDANAPVSPAAVLQHRFPVGMGGGGSAGAWGGWDTGQFGTEKSKIYLSQWIKLAGPTFENHTVGTKLGFIASGETCCDNQNILFLRSPSGIASAFTLELRQQNMVSRNIGQNVDARPLMTAGVWHHWEVVMELNDVGVANGVLRWWIDGTLIMDHRDVVYRTSGNERGFFSYKFAAIWGGIGGNKTQDDFVHFDHTYLSGINK